MDLLQQITALEERVQKLEQLINSNNTPKTTKQLSIREFINRAAPSTANDTVLVIAYYIEVVRGSGSFTIDALRNGLAEAKIPTPKNLSDVIGKNIRKGYVMPSQETTHTNRSWVVTSTGEEYVNGLAQIND